MNISGFATTPTAVVLILVLSLWLAQAPGATAMPREKERWIQVDTAHFTLFSNAKPATATGVAGDLERFRAVLARLTTGEVQAPIPTLVYLFRDDRAFKPYRPFQDGKPMDVGGRFLARSHANYFLINATRHRETTNSAHTLYAFHFLRQNQPRLPQWFRRGLAEYYGTIEIEEMHADVGKPAAGLLWRLLHNPAVSLAELFAVEKHPGYRRGDLGQRFDAECWVVVHYLLADDERRLQADAFISQRMDGVPQKVAFEQAFKTTYIQMQRQLRHYIESSAYGFRRFHMASTGGEEAPVEPMARADVLYRLGDLLVNEKPARPEAAAEHFQAALEAAPEHGPALAGLGQVAEREERYEAALEHYRRAAALTPDDYLIQYRYADSLLRGDDGSRAPEAREALERSVAAKADFAPARELLEEVAARSQEAESTAREKELLAVVEKQPGG